MRFFNLLPFPKNNVTYWISSVKILPYFYSYHIWVYFAINYTNIKSINVEQNYDLMINLKKVQIKHCSILNIMHLCLNRCYTFHHAIILTAGYVYNFFFFIIFDYIFIILVNHFYFLTFIYYSSSLYFYNSKLML